MAEVWVKRCQRQNDLCKFWTEECEVRMFPSMPACDAVYPSKVPSMFKSRMGDYRDTYGANVFVG